jgi:toxin-antitoxin system PIN domain toxin
MPRPLLLDVNVLIALFDSAHVHHLITHRWFKRNKARGWRTCPITENGFLRILSNPAYPNGPLSVLNLAIRLEEFKRTQLPHEFWPDDFSLSKWIQDNEKLMSSGKLTDVYLLRLAAARNGTLATLDSGITCELTGENKPDIVEWVR